MEEAVLLALLLASAGSAFEFRLPCVRAESVAHIPINIERIDDINATDPDGLMAETRIFVDSFKGHWLLSKDAYLLVQPVHVLLNAFQIVTLFVM